VKCKNLFIYLFILFYSILFYSLIF